MNGADGSASCTCNTGFAGDTCGECAEGFVGDFPSCERAPIPEGGTLTRDNCHNLSALDECLGEQLAPEEDDPGQDVIFLFDATGSMRDDQSRLSENFAEVVASIKESGGNLAIAWYKDNQGCDAEWFGMNDGNLLSLAGDEAADNESALRDFMGGISVSGGCDLPESLWDGVYDAVDRANWTSSVSRTVVVLTDAPFHGDDKSIHTQEEIGALLGAKGVNVTIVNVALSY